jgi:hypothetical protein
MVVTDFSVMHHSSIQATKIKVTVVGGGGGGEGTGNNQAW